MKDICQMKRNFLCSVLVSFCFLMACRKSGNMNTEIIHTYNFSAGAEEWTADFADYPNEPGVELAYAFEFFPTGLPFPLDEKDGAIKQSGINRSDDLFMFIKRKIPGLEPGRKYSVDIMVDIATNAASNMVGVGGAPGEGVAIKTGVVSFEPKKLLNTAENYFRMNLDKSNQQNSGADMKVIGNFANGTGNNEYRLKQLKTITPLMVQANTLGEIWLILGTDSGFEGKTSIYYNSIKATIR